MTCRSCVFCAGLNRRFEGGATAHEHGKISNGMLGLLATALAVAGHAEVKSDEAAFRELKEVLWPRA